MRVLIKHVSDYENELVTIECVEETHDINDIKEYCLAKGNVIIGYLNENVMKQIPLLDILYFEAVGERVFAYTKHEVYEIKKRLYEVEEEYRHKHFARCSKSFVINLLQIEALKPALNGRFEATMNNEEKIIISRQYAKEIKQIIMEEL